MNEPDMLEEKDDDQEQVPLNAPNWKVIYEQGLEKMKKKTQTLGRTSFFLVAGYRLCCIVVRVIYWLWCIVVRVIYWLWCIVVGVILWCIVVGVINSSELGKPFTERDRFVRLGEIPQKDDKTIRQYIDHGDGTITDIKTGLMWKRCSEGLSGDNCEHGKVERYTWKEAVKRFKNVKYAGYTDWRLSTISELETLVVYSCRKRKDKYADYTDWWLPIIDKPMYERPTINQQAFPNTAIFYWSGSPHMYFSDSAWYVNFSHGYSSSGNRYVNYAVRLVRNGQ
ncbi:MAG: DUF1566 domain-containing protein [Candidatus Electrothrix sp. AW1]|nr:DUF1566 domain-containing protein [Candidatus Electrothrix sp. AX1]MCI5183137.1 DUF1566 domain-containing protein [Candidatus Electrothrix gigas]